MTRQQIHQSELRIQFDFDVPELRRPIILEHEDAFETAVAQALLLLFGLPLNVPVRLSYRFGDWYNLRSVNTHPGAQPPRLAKAEELTGLFLGIDAMLLAGSGEQRAHVVEVVNDESITKNEHPGLDVFKGRT